MLDQLLMQITNASVVPVVPASDLFDQINAVATQISLLVTVVGGIVTYAITSFRKVRKEELTQRDKQLMELAKDIQMGFQKGVETIGQTKDVARVLYEAQIPEAERKKLQAQLEPILTEADIRLQKANEQAALIKAKAVQMFGPEADVDQDKTIPRESAIISERLRKV